jgi:hypothetical protein
MVARIVMDALTHRGQVEPPLRPFAQAALR